MRGKPMTIALRVAGVLVAIWVCFVASVFYVMHQPPERLAAVMAKMAMPAFLLTPFERMWFSARGGSLNPGDPAPDFRLATLDKSSQVSLGSFRGNKPVCLIFGSYT
jgi:hypothetical protein